MRILFVGDVVGKVGRSVVQQHLQSIKTNYDIHLTIINGENSAHGKGITSRLYNEIIDMGADVITLGNHAFSKSELLKTVDQCPSLVRPMNLLPLNVGNYVVIKEVNGLKVAIVNICGEIFMDRIVRSPYDCMDEVLETVEADCYFVDFHGEATAEKLCFWNYYRKQLIAVCGTHTHIQTADECVEDGCAFICDTGMCGAYDSILGRDTKEVIANVVYQESTHYTPAMGEGLFCAVVIEVDEKTKRAVSIERIQIRPKRED